MKIFVLAVGLLFAFATLPERCRAESNDKYETSPRISVSARGNASAAPDMAIVSAGVVSRATSARAAMADNARLMSRVFQELEAAGVPKKHIQTTQLNLNPQYDYSDRKAPRITGYQASNTVRVTSHDLKNLGNMLDVLVNVGANQIHSIQFGLQDSDNIYALARKDAVLQARSKAKTLAEAAGVTLGKVLHIAEGHEINQPMPYQLAARADGASFKASTPVAGGEQSYSVTVTMIYAIRQ